MGEMLYQGKVKQVWSTDDPDTYEFRFTNQISVFDQIIPSLIPRKGESLNRTTAHWFKLVEEAGICKTHLIEVNAPDRCLVRKVKVIKEPGAIPRDMEWVFVPLEVIVRHYLSGSAWRRFQRGELTAEALGVAQDCEYGVKLAEPFVEVTTKFEAFDRNIGRAEALEISNITEEEYEKIVAAALAVDAIIEEEAAKNGLIHVDGKKEFALGANREVVLVDTFGTLDEDRWWDAEASLTVNASNCPKNLSGLTTLEPVTKLLSRRLETPVLKTHRFLPCHSLLSMRQQHSTLRCTRD